MTKSIPFFAALLALFASHRPEAADAANVQVFGRLLSIGGEDEGESIYVDERHGRGYFDYRGRYYPGETYLLVRVLDSIGETVVRKYFHKDEISSIAIKGNGGDDYIEVNTDLPADLFGDAGLDEIYGGSGDDYIDAGHGFLDVVDGRQGDDVLFSGEKWFLPGVLSPATEMRGGLGRDTFVYRNSDTLLMDDFSGPGWMVTPDYTFSSGQYAGMHLVAE